MDIAILGAGNVGSVLAGAFAKAGHSVTVTATSQESAEEAAGDTGARAATDNREAAQGAGVVVVAVPRTAVDDLIGEIGEDLDGKIVIDVINRFHNDDLGQGMDGTSIAERIQATVPGARVVKALNYAFASRMADPQVDGTRLDGFVAADDEGAKKDVLDLLGSIGFEPVDAGPLVMARALEGLAILTIGLNMWNNWSWANGWKVVGPRG